MPSNQLKQDISESQMDLFDENLIEFYEDEIPVTVLNGNLNSLDIDLIRLEFNNKPISINVAAQELKEFYMDNPYIIFWKILNDLRTSPHLAAVLEKSGLRITYEYNS